MNERIFEDFGIGIFIRDGRFFARYDAGELVAQIVEVEITEYEAKKAQNSEKDAYEVLVVAEMRGANRTFLKG